MLQHKIAISFVLLLLHRELLFRMFYIHNRIGRFVKNTDGLTGSLSEA